MAEDTKAERLKNIAATTKIPAVEGYQGYQPQLAPGFASPAEEEKYWRDKQMAYRAERGETFGSALQAIPNVPQVDLSEIITRRQQQLGGFNAPEAAAFRSQMAAGLARQQQAAQRQLAAQQARAGIRGGAATSQGQQLLQNLGQARAAQERELFVANIGEQQRRQKEYEELKKQEQFSGLAGELARLQMAASELQSRRGLQMASEIAGRQQEAAKGGGCLFTVLVTTSLLGGLNNAEAQEIIQASKTGSVHRCSDAQKAVAEELNMLRSMRDTQCDERTLRGYYKVSEAIVPLIADNRPACKLVRACIAKPAVAYMNNAANILAKAITKFWFGVAWVFGSNKPFTRSNGEIV